MVFQIYFDPIKSMSEKVRLSSVELGRQTVVMFLVKKKFMKGRTNTLLLFIHWFHLSYGPITMERPFINRSVPKLSGPKAWCIVLKTQTTSKLTEDRCFHHGAAQLDFKLLEEGNAEWWEPLPSLLWKKFQESHYLARNKDFVEPIEKMKIFVWVAMTASCLSGLHISSL